MDQNKFENGSYFLQRFLQNPKHIASVWPSSQYLAMQMFHGLGLADGDVVLEYGPGTGSFTLEVERLRTAGVNLRYLGIERDPGMHQYLRRRFPKLEFVLGDASNAPEICESRDVPRAAAIISGLPLVLMNYPTVSSIFAATQASLRPDGVFRTFSYVHSYPTRRAGELRSLLQRDFEEYELSRPVVRNLPPAFTLTGRTPRQGAIHASR